MSKAVEDILRDALKLGQDMTKTENAFAHGEKIDEMIRRLCIDNRQQNDLFISLCAHLAEKGV